MDVIILGENQAIPTPPTIRCDYCGERLCVYKIKERHGYIFNEITQKNEIDYTVQAQYRHQGLNSVHYNVQWFTKHLPQRFMQYKNGKWRDVWVGEIF